LPVRRSQVLVSPCKTCAKEKRKRGIYPPIMALLTCLWYVHDDGGKPSANAIQHSLHHDGLSVDRHSAGWSGTEAPNCISSMRVAVHLPSHRPSRRALGRRQEGLPRHCPFRGGTRAATERVDQDPPQTLWNDLCFDLRMSASAPSRSRLGPWGEMSKRVCSEIAGRQTRTDYVRIPECEPSPLQDQLTLSTQCGGWKIS
jgi:hypothetical protein